MSDPTSPVIIETRSETFERDVLERSQSVPVVVDFWASWCQPCRLLGPVLEKLAREYAGRFVLVKADTEALPELAEAFGVASIPAVFAVKDGQVVDGFVGVQSESAIRAFLDRLMPSPAERRAAEAKALEATDPAAAEARYRSALELDPDLSAAAIGRARALLTLGRLEEARDQIAQLERRGYLEPEAEAVKAELTLKAGAEASGDLDAARAVLAADPADRRLRLRLAEALAAAGQYAEALDRALALVEEDRRGTGEDARKLMLAVFQLLPPDTPLLAEYQRRLSVAL